MEKDLISVIVPVYNVENYIKFCVDSLLNQTYKNIEIILVDDGSKDSSGSICDYYKKKDDRVVVFHKNNGGLSDARNYGMEKARGKYIAFIDSDDYIDLNYFEKLIENMKFTNAEIVSASKILEYPRRKIVVNASENFCVTSKEALLKMFQKEEFDNSACDKLFKKALFDDIKFPKDKYYEDMYTIYKIVLKSKTVSHITSTYYHYRINSNSISNERFSSKQLDCVDASREAHSKMAEVDPEIADAAKSYFVLQISNCMQKIYNSSDRKKYANEYKALKNELTSLRKYYIKTKFISIKKKFMIFLVDIGLIPIVNFVKKIIYL